MTRRGRRSLTPEERELWNRVKGSATPMHQRPPPRTDAAPPDMSKIFDPEPVRAKPIAPFQVGEKRTATAVPQIPKDDAPEVLMDKKAYGQMRRGKKKPEARVDLHGMTQARAHGVLNTFIQDSFAQGLRLVLVITGKGKDRDEGGPIPTPRGVLRHAVPHWLRLPPLSLMVLQVSEAHLKHGGAGAYYVYLRRRK